jgi:uncharacterized protein YdeI (YjbR/CyaY-like superfamily)
MQIEGVNTCYAANRSQWRKWLEENHQTAQHVWLIMYKKQSGAPSVYYDEAVEEALCFGWIDSKANKRDENSFYQFFARRNSSSKWSKFNKVRVEKLLSQGLIQPAGMAMIELAKQNGMWTALDEVENLILPLELEHDLNKNPQAKEYFSAFPKSVKRAILEWISNAKREETRQKRISETVEMAAKNIRANQYRQK